MNSDTEKVSPLEKKTVLIVDDYVINVELLKIFVQETGALALSASNGIECLDIIKNHKVDMILMDLNMPEMNGLETTKTIRSIPQFKDVIIIGVIGYEDNEEIDLCRQAGMNNAVPKFSFSPDKLIEFGNTYFNSVNLTGSNNSFPAPPENTLINSKHYHNNSIMDFDKALKEFENDTELLLNLSQDFTLTIQKQIDLIDEAFQKNDLNRMEFEAHSIKGGAANLCAYPLSNAAKELETACKTGQSGEIIFGNLTKLQKQINDFSDFIELKKKESITEN